jgi:hypothetical protein
MTKYTDEKGKESLSQSLRNLAQFNLSSDLLLVNTSSYEAKELLIKIMIPVRNLSYVVLGRPVGIVGVLVPPYLMMMQDGQCHNFLDTDVSERLA